MKFGKLILKQKRNQTVKKAQPIEDYGRNQLQELAKKGLSFQIVVL